MNPWTESARSALEAYFAKTRKSLESSGADVNEVIDDLRRHVEQEIAASRLTVVTEQDVRQILARVGSPEPVERGAPKSIPRPDQQQSQAPPTIRPGPVTFCYLWESCFRWERLFLNS